MSILLSDNWKVVEVYASRSVLHRQCSHVHLLIFMCQIWFYDGSVSCFEGWHILLAVTALLSLLSLTLLIPLVAAAVWFEFLLKKVKYTHCDSNFDDPILCQLQNLMHKVIFPSSS